MSDLEKIRYAAANGTLKTMCMSCWREVYVQDLRPPLGSMCTRCEKTNASTGKGRPDA